MSKEERNKKLDLVKIALASGPLRLGDFEWFFETPNRATAKAVLDRWRKI